MRWIIHVSENIVTGICKWNRICLLFSSTVFPAGAVMTNRISGCPTGECAADLWSMTPFAGRTSLHSWYPQVLSDASADDQPVMISSSNIYHLQQKRKVPIDLLPDPCRTLSCLFWLIKITRYLHLRSLYPLPSTAYFHQHVRKPHLLPSGSS